MLDEPHGVEPQSVGQHALLDRFLYHRVVVDHRALHLVGQAQSHARRILYTALVGPIAAAWARLSAATRSGTFEGKTAPESAAETTAPTADAPLSTARKWTITAAVMLVTIMQVLDVTVTNVALPHIQGSLSAAVDEVSWVLTSYLAANAIILPATGWLAGVLGRKRFFLACTIMFTLASMLCGLAPNIETLLVARVL